MSLADRESHKSYHVNFLEKLIVNFAFPPDFVYHTFRARFTGDKSQTSLERAAGLWNGKVAKYQKLLRVKVENSGQIPDDYRELCNRTPCGRVRLMLASMSPARIEAPPEPPSQQPSGAA